MANLLSIILTICKHQNTKSGDFENSTITRRHVFSWDGRDFALDIFICIFFIWVRSRNCGCLVTWFCYQLIAKPGNKTATVSWRDPHKSFVSWFKFPWSLFLCVHWHRGSICVHVGNGFAPNTLQITTWADGYPFLWRIYTSPCFIEIIVKAILYSFELVHWLGYYGYIIQIIWTCHVHGLSSI